MCPPMSSVSNRSVCFARLDILTFGGGACGLFPSIEGAGHWTLVELLGLFPQAAQSRCERLSVTLSGLATLASIVSSIAVVVSVVFLTLQLGQMAKATAANSMSAWLGNFHGTLSRLSTNPELTLTVRRGLANFEKLPANDQVRFNAFMASLLLNSQFVFNQRNAGSFDPRIADQILGFSAGMLQTKGGGQWWALMHEHVAADYRAKMDSLVRAGNLKAPMRWFTEPVE